MSQHEKNRTVENVVRYIYSVFYRPRPKKKKRYRLGLNPIFIAFTFKFLVPCSCQFFILENPGVDAYEDEGAMDWKFPEQPI